LPNIPVICFPSYYDFESLSLPTEEKYIIFIIIIIIIILVITFMQSIYNYIPETNHVSRVYRVAAVLYLQFVLHVMLFRPEICIIIIIITARTGLRHY